MLKKPPGHPQADLPRSVDQYLDSRRQEALHDPHSGQHSFYREMFVHIDESLFPSASIMSVWEPPDTPVNKWGR